MDLTPSAKVVLEKRYLRNGETAEQMLKRVATNIAEVEKIYGGDNSTVGEWTLKFFRMMDDLLFLPNSPTLMNAGRPLQQLSACFLLPVEDSIAEIFEAVKITALIHQSGGGSGFSFSHLRPEGDLVSTTGGKASGPVTFMQVFNTGTEVVKQGGTRRGANLGTLLVSHPDIYKFITAKSEGGLENFNLSVSVTDEFMEAVKENSDYNLINPRSGEVVGTLPAGFIFQLIVQGAWETGDPGILFIDEINRHNPTPGFKIEGTNPCVTGSTLIMTDEGPIEISSRVDQETTIWNGHEFSTVIPRLTGENQSLVKVSFSDGSSLECTPYHRFPIETATDPRRSKVIQLQAKDLKPGMKLERFNYPVIPGKDEIDQKLAYTIGVFAGDGAVESSRDRKSIWLYGEKRNLLPYLVSTHINECAGDRTFVSLPSDFNFDKDWVPSTQFSIQTRLDWLAGLLDTDAGSVGSGGYSIWSVNHSFLLNVKLMLHTLGIGAILSLGKKQGQKLMPDGKGGSKEYTTQDCWRLTISGTSIANLVKLGLCTRRIDTTTRYPMGRSRLIGIRSIEELTTKSDVYCFSESLRHKGMFGCVTTLQCGEQPLLPYESCNLGSLNLGRFFTTGISGPGFDYPQLKETIHTAIRFLDNVIDANRYPIPEIEEMTKKTRKIGLGIMGWADLLIKLGLRYGSPESLRLAYDVMAFINKEAYWASHNLALERGNFPLWEESIYASGQIGESMRNACRTTIAPTGTISIIAGASSGIEPLFALAYTRENILDQGDVLEEVYPPLVEAVSLFPTNDILDYVKKTGSLAGSGIEIPSLEPFVTALEISYPLHIAMQAAFQENTDNAISKTINLPNSATQEDIRDAYLLAWESRCKGITLYRDGSRDFQVLNSGTEEIVEITEPVPTQLLPPVVAPRRRPVETQGTTTKIPTGCGHLYVTVNQDGTGICEVFSTLGKAGGCAAAQSEAVSRLISLTLRSGIDPQEIIGQLQGIRCPSVAWNDGRAILSCPDALGQVLGAKMLSNLGEEIQMNVVAVTESNLEKKNFSFTKIINSGGQCPECSHILVYQEGCFICPGCGYTKCG